MLFTDCGSTTILDSSNLPSTAIAQDLAFKFRLVLDLFHQVASIISQLLVIHGLLRSESSSLGIVLLCMLTPFLNVFYERILWGQSMYL